MIPVEVIYKESQMEQKLWKFQKIIEFTYIIPDMRQPKLSLCLVCCYSNSEAVPTWSELSHSPSNFPFIFYIYGQVSDT